MRGEIGYVRIEKARNGFIVDYSQKSKNQKFSMYDEANYVDQKELFTEKEQDKAFARFQELKMKEWAGEVQYDKDDLIPMKES